MNVLPVIEREMRAQARHSFTYLLRVLSASALLLAALIFRADYGIGPRLGSLLFSYLNCALFVSIWVLVPLLSADCISRERREGTVGLLFLTPLKAREIVLAKGFVHGLRSLTLWLSVLPVLTIVFLLGGVTWKEAVLSVLMNFSSICWALAAGLIASSYSKPWVRAILLSAGLALCFSVVFVIFNGIMVTNAISADPSFRLGFPYQYARWQFGPNRAAYIGGPLQWHLPAGFFAATDLEAWWGDMFRVLTRASQRAWLVAAGETALLSVVFLLAAVLVAAGNLRRGWQEEPPSAKRIWFEETFCTPVIGVHFFHRWLRRKLERNPIGWLEQRTWTGRLVTWGWFAVLVSFYSVIFYAPNIVQLLPGVQTFMAWSLLMLVAVSAAGSFQRERETRVLELLLVSPMTAGEIIAGRLRGLWGQFLPSFVLMVTVWLYLGIIFHNQGNQQFSLLPFFCVGYFTLPVIGLYYSLKRSNFISSFLTTLFVGLFVPKLLSWLATWLLWVYFMANSMSPFSVISTPLSQSQPVLIFQAAIALWLGWKLHQNLVHRTFAFSTSTT
jgi:ABC-type transport system involved in multi-copper enzyme maturation permease subunit